jgi:hypothetical protein
MTLFFERGMQILQRGDNDPIAIAILMAACWHGHPGAFRQIGELLLGDVAEAGAIIVHDLVVRSIVQRQIMENALCRGVSSENKPPFYVTYPIPGEWEDLLRVRLGLYFLEQSGPCDGNIFWQRGQERLESYFRPFRA